MMSNIMAKRERTSLAKYKARRNFAKSPEPKPVKKKSKAKGLMFCVQKHLATALHYDFRLEYNGVLLSWAVPKGPSLNPADKRLAMKVEDHPIDYGDFEGVIPEGYGAGVVVLWDRGTWTPENGDPGEALAKGELKFSVDGVKLKGSFVLVRTRGFGGKESWLLIKHRDQWAGDVDITEFAPNSVKSDRDLEDVLADNKRVAERWADDPPVRGGQSGKLFAQVISHALGSNGRAPKNAETWQSHKPSKKQKPVAAAKPKAAKRSTGKPIKPPKASKSATKLTHEPNFTNLDKPLWPNGFTKGQMIDYYIKIAPKMLEYTLGRAITLKRWPNGVDDKVFFEKRCPSHAPDWVNTVNVVRSDANESIDYCTIDSASTLAWTAQIAAIELHVPLAYAADPDTPTHMVFDLDPGAPAGIKECAKVALKLRSMFKKLKLQCCIKSSGSKGLHLYVPFNTNGITFADTKALARAIAMMMEEEDDLVVSDMAKTLRKGKVLIDWSQNDRNKTTVCTWSMRGKEEPSVSYPLKWADVPKLRTAVLSPEKALKVSDAEFRRIYHLKQAMPKLA
jgi:bifunctional non-homologous end joining protein LigD